MAAARELTIGVIQMALESTLEENRSKIIAQVGVARAQECRVAIFPETALAATEHTTEAEIERAVEDIQRTARANDIYVVMGLHQRHTDKEGFFDALYVVDPTGEIVLRYQKLYSLRHSRAPGRFLIDGAPCSAILCADRWIRSVEDLPAILGSRVIIECSNNYANEWVPELGWYWYVPRALRNGAYVVFANTGTTPGHQEWAMQPSYSRRRHGHCAVIDPDGRVMVSSENDEPDRMLVAVLDLDRATNREAQARRAHPIVGPWWEAGARLVAGGRVDARALDKPPTPEVPIGIAIAQMACSKDVEANAGLMVTMIGRAANEHKADIVAFPELAVTGNIAESIRAADDQGLAQVLAQVQGAAKEYRIAVAFGMPVHVNGKWHNCAFVVGSEGQILARYAQIVVDRPDLFAPGMNMQDMWFQINGVPAVITVGRREALWSEIAEIAALGGAQVHLHLEHDPDVSAQGALLRQQIWINLASYRTLTAAVNAASPHRLARPSAPCNGGSTIYEDFRRKRGHGHYPFSAVPIVAAGSDQELIYATCSIGARNAHLDQMSKKLDSTMRKWYLLGSVIAHGRAKR